MGVDPTELLLYVYLALFAVILPLLALNGLASAARMLLRLRGLLG